MANFENVKLIYDWDDGREIREIVLELKTADIVVVVTVISSLTRPARCESLGVTHIKTDYLEPCLNIEKEA